MQPVLQWVLALAFASWVLWESGKEWPFRFSDLIAWTPFPLEPVVLHPPLLLAMGAIFLKFHPSLSLIQRQLGLVQ